MTVICWISRAAAHHIPHKDVPNHTCLWCRQKDPIPLPSPPVERKLSFSTHSDVLILIVTIATSLLMDFAYTLVNRHNVPASGCPYTIDRHMQSCSNHHWNIWKRWLNTLGMMRNHFSSCMKLSALTPRMTKAVMVHATTKQVSILNLPMMQHRGLVSNLRMKIKTS
jgi:hypothetical protein